MTRLALILAFALIASAAEADAGVFSRFRASRRHHVAATVAPQAPTSHYAPRWTGCNGNWRHLMQGEHAGKFNADDLKKLTPDQINALHDKDHDEMRARRQAVVVPKAPVRSDCPTGGCPVDGSRRVFFGRLGW